MDNIWISNAVLSRLPVQHVEQKLDGMRDVPVRQREDRDEEVVDEVLEGTLGRQQTSQIDLGNVYERVLVRIYRTARVRFGLGFKCVMIFSTSKKRISMMR